MSNVLSIASKREELDGLRRRVKELEDELSAEHGEWLRLTGDGAFPGFGVDPKDSLALLTLREAIDTHLGWRDELSEARADYPARIAEVGHMLRNAGLK